MHRESKRSIVGLQIKTASGLSQVHNQSEETYCQLMHGIWGSSATRFSYRIDQCVRVRVSVRVRVRVFSKCAYVLAIESINM